MIIELDHKEFINTNMVESFVVSYSVSNTCFVTITMQSGNRICITKTTKEEAEALVNKLLRACNDTRPLG